MIKQIVERPIADSYWVQPGRLLAGEYPRNADVPSSRMKLRSLLYAGITYMVDLTASWERGHEPYDTLYFEEAARLQLSVIYRRMPITDYSIPSILFMQKILDVMDEALRTGHGVYVHCFGGTGRTGTVIGCYLVRHGMTGPEAVRAIKMWRQGTPDGRRPSPQTVAQRDMVLHWRRGH